MEKEYMSVGELAAMMGVTVRTLQYYDKEGLLKPSSLSQSGRRLYSAKDVIKLHQIISFKYLGFSLEEIKAKLFNLDTPKEVAAILEQQKNIIKEQIDGLSEAFDAIDILHKEVLAIQTVDFKKYAEIIELLRVGNKEYWVWKHLDSPLADHIKDRFSDDPDGGLKILDTYKEVLEEVYLLKNQGEFPESPKSLCAAEKWWNMILAFTGGDMSLIPELEKFNNTKDNWGNEFVEKQKAIDEYLKTALNCYLSNIGFGIPGSEPTELK